MKIANFTEDDIKQWDGITPDKTVSVSDLPDRPTFTIPSSYKGLTDFKVEFVESSVIKNNNKGEFYYKVKVINSDLSKSKTILVSYTGFKSNQNEQEQPNTDEQDRTNIARFTEDDIKQWDGITPDKTVSVSALPDQPTFALPSTYKGISGFEVQVLGSSLKNDSLGNYKYTVEVRNNSGKVRKTIKVSYILSFKRNIKISQNLDWSYC